MTQKQFNIFNTKNLNNSIFKIKIGFGAEYI